MERDLCPVPRTSRPRCAFIPLPGLPLRRTRDVHRKIRPFCSARPAISASRADGGPAQHSQRVFMQLPARWRRAATVAAAIAAAAFLPARTPNAVGARPLGEAAAPVSESCETTFAPRRSSATCGAIRIRTAPVELEEHARGNGTAFVESVAVFRGKAAEVKNSLIHALTNEDGEGHSNHQAAVNDALVLLLTTVVIVPLMRRLNTSPILGFLAAGIALGPNGFGLVRDVATSKALAELGVVFFLFEMGLELSTSKLKSLGADVFGLGTAQFLITGFILSLATYMAKIPSTTAIVIGAALALSSSAFVLQLLSERGEVGTRFGRAAFGILIFQDLAVVPVLVLTPLLAGAGGAQAVLTAISIASAKAAVALLFIVFMGKNFLQPVFRFVARAKNSEAFIAVILLTVLGTSSLTQALGLSDTLGAFLAGVMLAETKFRHQVEADIKPFRGLLLGLFFITVGFSVDLNLALANLGTVASLVTGLLAVKAAVIAAAGVAFGMSTGSSIRTGLMLAQGGEFAFVIFGLAQGVGVLPPDLAQLLLLVVALSMALTPTLADLGRKIASRLESRRGLIGMRIEDADTADARDFVMVAGYGRVGQSVCEMLDAKLVRYMAFDMSPTRVIDARNKGLPVYFGDACRPEVLRSAGVARARAIVITLDDPKAALQAVQNIRREFADLRIFCRARDNKHKLLLEAAGAGAIVPELLEASLLLGGAVLLDYGTPMDEVNALIEEARMETWNDLALGENTSASLRSQFMSSRAEDSIPLSETVEAKVTVAEEPVLVADMVQKDGFSGKGTEESEGDVVRVSKNAADAVGPITTVEPAARLDEEEDPEDIYAPPRVSPVIPRNTVTGGSADSGENGTTEKTVPPSQTTPSPTTGLNDVDTDGVGLSPTRGPAAA